MSRLRALNASTVTALAAAVLLVPASAHAHVTGTHTGFISTVSTIEPQQPGLLVRVLGGHEQLSVANLTAKTVVILDGRGDARVSVPPGRTRVWTEPRVGSAEAPPEREGLVRYWRIPGTADGEPFEIVGFLGYRAPPDTEGDDGLPTWVYVAAGAFGALVLAAAIVLPRRRARA